MNALEFVESQKICSYLGAFGFSDMCEGVLVTLLFARLFLIAVQTINVAHKSPFPMS